jgi:hypothetical protein
MRGHLIRLILCSLVLTVAAARAATAQTCVVIDEKRDMLAESDRRAAFVLVAKQFETAGVTIADAGGAACRSTYTIFHVRLGSTIIVTLTGPEGTREGTALGLDDLPAVYSQLVRSLLTNKPMGSLAVLDRTNVSAVQDVPPRRVQSEGAWYARLGQATVFGPKTHSGASFGFGYRAEFNRLGLDVSFLNLQPEGNDGSYYGGRDSASTASLVKMEGLMFTNPTGNRTAYFGGGLSYGWTTLHSSNMDMWYSNSRGAGLQGELTAGYELARVTSVRLFVQADATLPFYKVEQETFTFVTPPSNGRYVTPTIDVQQKYVPSLAVSVGIGWQRRR